MTISLSKDYTFELTDHSDFLESGYLGIYIVQLNKTSGSEIVHTFKTEYEGLVEETYEFPLDGYYTIAKIIVPTSKPEILPEDIDIFYYATKVEDDYKYYKYQVSTDTTAETDLLELVEVNTVGTNLYRELLNYFSTCYLYKCYVDLVKKLYSELFSTSNNNNKGRCPLCNSTIDTNLKYKRDLVQSTLSVLQYLVDCDKLAEAERILERIGSCNGICPTANSKISNLRCGCQN